MFFPLNLLKAKTEIFPLLGDQLIGEPYIFNFSSDSIQINKYLRKDFDHFQSIIFDELKDNNAEWGIGRYLEERKKLLSQFPQFLSEKRFYHLGLDIVVPADFNLYAPVEATVFRTGIDSGYRNYGGFVVLKHVIMDHVFYSFYGHLKTDFIVREGDIIKQGERFAQIGEREDSGEWFTHTHLQILTQRAVDEDLITKGYISEENIKNIEDYFSSPYFLFRY